MSKNKLNIENGEEAVNRTDSKRELPWNVKKDNVQPGITLEQLEKMKEEIQSQWRDEQQEKEDLRLNREIAFKRSLEIEMQEMRAELDTTQIKVNEFRDNMSP